MVFEEDNGNYLAFSVGAQRDDESLLFIDHEGMYRYAPSAGSLTTLYIKAAMDGYDEELLGSLTPFVPQVYSKPLETPASEAPLRVSHPKFGSGVCVKKDRNSKHEKWTVEFDDGETRKLLARFLTPE